MGNKKYTNKYIAKDGVVYYFRDTEATSRIDDLENNITSIEERINNQDQIIDNAISEDVAESRYAKIDDVYTKLATDSKYAGKDSVYTKNEVDSRISSLNDNLSESIINGLSNLRLSTAEIYATKQSINSVANALENNYYLKDSIDAMINDLHTEITSNISAVEVPTDLKDFTDATGLYVKRTDLANFATKAEVENRFNLINGASEKLDTLQELANSINNDENFAGSVLSALENKANKSDVYTKEQLFTKAEIEAKNYIDRTELEQYDFITREALSAAFSEQDLDTRLALYSTREYVDNQILRATTNINSLSLDSFVRDGELVSLKQEILGGANSQNDTLAKLGNRIDGVASLINSNEEALNNRVTRAEMQQAFVDNAFVSESRVDSKISVARASILEGLDTVATTGSYLDLKDKPNIPVIPTNISSFTNDRNYITSSDISNTLDNYATKEYVDQHIESESGSSSGTVIVSGSGDVFTVNGEAKPNGEVTLESEKTYTLSGKLYGHIIIPGSLTEYIETEDEEVDSSKNYYTYNSIKGEYELSIGKNSGLSFNSSTVYYEKPSYKKTVLVLNNVEIISDTKTAISYEESVKSVEISLAEGSKNKVICRTIGENDANESTAAIFSNNSMKISGSGKLEVINNYSNHAIKAMDELVISGKPTIVIDNGNGHDGLHGTDGVIINNGNISITSAKDAIGTGDNGSVKIYAGKFVFKDISESAIDSKVPGFIYNKDWVQIEGNKTFNGITVYNEYLTTGTVTTDTGSAVSYSSGIYTISAAGDYILQGNIEASIVITSKNVNLLFDNVHLIGNIQYQADKSRVCIELSDNTINIIEGRITSENNIEIKGKGILYISSDENAIEGSTISIRGDGNKYIKSEAYSVKGTEIFIGEEHSDADSDKNNALIPATNSSESDQELYIGKIYARLNSTRNKKGAVVIYENQKGFVCIDKIKYEILSTDAQQGTGYIGNGVTIKIDPTMYSIGATEEKSNVLKGFDLVSGNVDELDEGTYTVINPVNNPFIDNTGALTISKNSNGSVIETWTSKNNIAFREFGEFNPIEAGIDSLKVNGVSVSTAISDEYDENGVKFTYEQLDSTNQNSQKIMWLEPGRDYELSGILLNCQIRVGYLSSWTKGGAFNAKNYDKAKPSAELRNMNITLNNFYLKNNSYMSYEATDPDSAEAAIEPFGPAIISYPCSSGGSYPFTLTITLANNSKNYLTRELVDDMETYNNKWGVIYSESENLIINGNGYLGIDDGTGTHLGCHAIKSKHNLTINDNPHIAASVYHDVLHGNDSLIVNGGYIQARYCNDVLGTDTTRGDFAIGKIRLINAIFDIRECFGTFIQADDAIVYPNVKVYFNTIGEGLWLECAPGFFKEISKKGELSGFGIVDNQNHTFKYRAFTEKPDAAAFDAYLGDTTKNGDPAVSCRVNGQVETYLVKADKTLNTAFPGITVYEGVSVIPDAQYSYSESARNTHVSTLVNSNASVSEYNLQFSATPVSTTISGEQSVSEINNLGLDELSIDNANFSDIDFVYNGTAIGGLWNVGITENVLNSYKNEFEYLISCVKGMIVPPKTISVHDIKSLDYNATTKEYTISDENTRDDMLVAASAIDAGAEVNGQITAGKIKAGADIYTSKTGLEPTITIKVGEAVRLYAALDPVNTTNPTIKWSMVGISEEIVLGRVMADDGSYCDFRGLQPGVEDFVLNTKALNKDNTKVSVKIHFVVEPADEVEEEIESFDLTGVRVITNPTDSELENVANYVSDITVSEVAATANSDEYTHVVVTADLNNIVEYTSSNPNQGTAKWIGLEIPTGFSSIIGISYNGSELTETDANEAAEVGCEAGSFVLYIKANEVVNTTKQFTLSKNGEQKIVKIDVIDSSST